ncbi:MAG TPA: GNAT family N-acetyltransferase, partial [Candidatus Limnocylindria bacterium]|nr:GNAT family N-acetyltransferase [Candidatus Limnocylindria bacterium]
MPLEIRPFAGTIEDYGRVVDVAFGSEYHAEDVPAFEPFFRSFDVLGAYDGERMVGGAALWRTSLTVPGGEVPAAAVTSVGVLPTHRRRGALTGMMRRQLSDLHEQGLPLAALWASEGAIYQRFGYGLATINATIEAERHRIAFRNRHEATGSVRFSDEAEARELIPALFEQVRLTRPGFFSRPADYWKAEIFYDPPHHRRGGGPLLSVVHETDGTPDGYAGYRTIQDWDARGPKMTLQLYELQATSAAAVRELWEYVFGVDLVATVRARPQPIDTPLLWSVTEPRRLGISIGDGLWLRIVDVAAALEGRGYAGEDRLVVELRDDVCDWNHGRWTLEASANGARVARTDGTPDLRLEAADLAALYL